MNKEEIQRDDMIMAFSEPFGTTGCMFDSDRDVSIDENVRWPH